jgi:hypothetical protein
MTCIINDQIAWQMVGEEVVLVNLDSAMAVGLNPVASLAFTLLEGHDEDHIVAEIVGNFRVEPDQARADLRAFVAQCVERRFLTIQVAAG